MEKTELRKQVIDFIVIYLSPKGEMIRKSELNQEVRKKLGGDFTSDPQWNLFYDSVHYCPRKSVNILESDIL